MTDDSKSDFPSLAEVIAAHRPHSRHCECDYEINSDWHWSRHVAAEWDRACRIETAERLSALPDDAIVGDNSGEAWRKSGMYYPDEPWWAAGDDVEQPATEIRLPARLLHHPDWRDA